MTIGYQTNLAVNVECNYSLTPVYVNSLTQCDVLKHCFCKRVSSALYATAFIDAYILFYIVSSNFVTNGGFPGPRNVHLCTFEIIE